MKRNNLDPKVLDFTWKQNHLRKDKESLKASMLDVIRKKPKAPLPPHASVMPKESGVAGTAMASGMGPGFGGQAGPSGTMMAMQQAPAAY